MRGLNNVSVRNVDDAVEDDTVPTKHELVTTMVLCSTCLYRLD